MPIWMLLLLLVVGAWAIARFRLQGPDLSRYDEPRDPPVPGWDEPSAVHHQVVDEVREALRAVRALPRKERLEAVRKQLDAGFGRPPGVVARFVPVEADGVSGEWVLSDAARPNRRLLYVHGGGFLAGSPKSHRAITAMLSQTAGAAVFSVDYRLSPEHRRRESIEDCRSAYRFVLENGPEGAAPAETLFVAGDSAGGNLTLVLLAWARDTGLRPADAAVALSPATDATFGSPSLRENLDRDPMLGPVMREFLRVPRWLLLLFTWASTRINPSDPRLSPVFGDLSGLPPLLIHASEAEILRDDAHRFARKAAAAGSPVVLETWPHVIHVWHAFAPDLPEAKEAYERIGAFLERHAPRDARGKPGSPA